MAFDAKYLFSLWIIFGLQPPPPPPPLLFNSLENRQSDFFVINDNSVENLKHVYIESRSSPSWVGTTPL